MKIASLLIPTYLPRPYPGATPASYQSSIVDNFEKALVALSPYVTRHPAAHRLHPDVQGRFVHQEAFTRYDVMVDPGDSSLGDAVLLALKSFNLAKIGVLFDDTEVADVDAASAEQMQQGLDPWNTSED